MGQIPLFDEGDIQPAHGEVAGDTAPGRTAADDENVWLVTHPFT